MDLDQDNSKCSVESMTSAERMELSPAETSGSAQDVDMNEDLCFQTEDSMDFKGVTDDENSSVNMSETPEKKFCFIPRSMLSMGHEDKKDDTEDESFVKSTAEDPLRAPEYESPDCNKSQRKGFGIEVVKRFEKNLKKFLEDMASRKITFRKDTRVLEWRPHSDGVKVIDDCGDMSRVPSTFSRMDLNRSSAPPSFNNETTKTSKVKEVLSKFLKTKLDISKDTPKSNEAKSTSKHSETPISVKIKRSLLERVPGTSQSKSTEILTSKHPDTPIPVQIKKSLLERVPATNPSKSTEIFKVPAMPSPQKSPNETKSDSPGTSEVTAISVPKRPSDFNVKMRTTFYTFSPGSDVLRQCSSFPNISRLHRRDEKKYRSVHYGDRKKVVRSLFSSDPNPCTQEKGVPTEDSTVGETRAGTSLEIFDTGSKETSVRMPSIQRNAPSRICRKLNFASHEEQEQTQAKEKAEMSWKEKSPPKRKESSPQVSKQLYTDVKKVRSMLEPEKCEEGEDEKIKNTFSSTQKPKD